MQLALRVLAIICLLVGFHSLRAQTHLSGQLINVQDSLPMPFVRVLAPSVQAQALSDETGTFTLNWEQNAPQIELSIYALGLSITQTVIVDTTETVQIFVNQRPTQIEGVEIEGLTAEKIVRKAIKAIPKTTPDSSYFSEAFFRQYYFINGAFKNLIEARSVVMFQRDHSNKLHRFKEAYAIPQLRRTELNRYLGDFHGDEYVDLMAQNPINHLGTSSLAPGYLEGYTFRFDTIFSDRYVIRYQRWKRSSENHGITNFDQINFRAEAWEVGRLTIRKEDLAIMRYERKAFRDPNYDYAWAANFVLPGRKYTIEFLEGHLIIDYQEVEGKWFPARILHRFTNEFFHVRTHRTAYKFTEMFEWHNQAISTQISEELLNQFFEIPNLSDIRYPYEPSMWEHQVPPFLFFPKSRVYADLEAESPIVEQFIRSGEEGEELPD
ncbi:hypothetical protein [Pontibacter sp. G13]|uniref:hypothetical protein n=1 Tax=Pontibacter sp. G13 TaxID=3074898 RepID=UPI00288B7D04|nr:hypothetical protein [Pontibacter sp. G13]WNJ19727.1 hypothetical protein RJD25_04525 [Pontibacter sp. G13]